MADAHTLSRELITGVVLAGGLGSRMGGQDKGLVPFAGQTLVAHTLARLSPQVGCILISANRNLAQYRRFAYPVITDADAATDLAPHLGPLGGLFSALCHCTTPYLLCVPCDAPLLPLDLVARLAAALGATAPPHATVLATAQSLEADGTWRVQPTFALMHTSVKSSLLAYLQTGRRSVQGWHADLAHATVAFTDAEAFANLNTPAALAALEASRVR